MAKNNYHHGDLKNALIEAGIEILSLEGISGLSMRKVARKAGVSHAAPYAHFADKQALVAAISTQGYRSIFERFSAAAKAHQDDPPRQLVECAWAYVQFALEHPNHYKITLSGVVEKEKDYPDLVEIAEKCFAALVQVVENSQQAGVLASAPTYLIAVTVWGLVHGLISLIQEAQVSHTVLERWGLRQMLIFSLNQITNVSLTPEMFALES
jgi:AcrR family transcriptional regulator